MMAQQKHLHELLREDQEPFQLKNYIADRRCLLKAAASSSSKTQLQVIKKRKPISQTTKFSSNFCKNACFLSFHDSPDPRKSPLFEFPSPAKAKSPCRSPNAIFLHIPARTATLLLEAALRIQKQTSNSTQKNQSKNNAFGFFGSMRRKLTRRNRNRKLDESGDGVKVSVKDILRWDSPVGRGKASNEEKIVRAEKKSAFEASVSETGMRVSCSCSAVWSESNEDNKSLDLDLETSCSSQSDDDFEEQEIEKTDFVSCEKCFCESPFRFVLQTSHSPGRRTPDFSSPAASPIHHKKEDKENHEIEIIKKFQVEAEEEEEEEKEQCSPVSILDPPFMDDDDGHKDEDEDEYDLECSYAIVQRAKMQLLHKLQRFEKLAELDPIELEKIFLEQQEDDKKNDTYHIEQKEGCERSSWDSEQDVDAFVKEVLSKSSFHQVPEDMTRLVADLIAEEERENWSEDKDVVVKRVCRRLQSWKEVESNTIDMMVEQDIRRECEGWKTYQEPVGETALELELAIFGLLMAELLEELVVN